MYNPTVIRRRYAGYTEFMFWGSYSWYCKDPCHIWQTESEAEKKAAQEELKRLNAMYEPIAKEAWKLGHSMRRLGLRSFLGQKPIWR